MSTNRSNQWAARKLTKRVVDRAPLPDSGQKFVRDTELKGFALRITAAGTKTFVVEKRIDGKSYRTSLGTYPALTVEQARREAQKRLGAIAQGRNPREEKREATLRAITLHEAFKEYRRVRELRPHTLYDYQRIMKDELADWQGKSLSDITKDMVARRHQELGARRGPAAANGALRLLRAVINFAMASYEDRHGNPIIPDNPVMRLTRTRAWFRVPRRKTVIKAHQLPVWFRAVQTLRTDTTSPQTETIADYLVFLLFTGMRRSEGARLRWEHIDLLDRTLSLPDTKNHEPLVLPLSDFLCELLEARRQTALSAYVFPGNGHPGPLVEPRRLMRHVTQASGVAFTLHDLRRTFITIAESLDVSAYALKRLVNHKMHNDVTAGYIITDVERLRAPMQQITDFLKQQAGIRGPRPAQVIALRTDPSRPLGG